MNIAEEDLNRSRINTGNRGLLSAIPYQVKMVNDRDLFFAQIKSSQA